MKKMISALLAIMMMVTLTACSGKTEVANLEGTTSDIIDQVYEKQESGLRVETMPVDLSDADAVKAYTGLDSADQLKEVSASESMMGSQPYSLVMVRVKDANNAKDVAEAMKAGIDQRKWICVEADDLAVAAYGDVVMLVMVGSNFGDLVTSAQMVAAFKDVCGGTLSVEL